MRHSLLLLLCVSLVSLVSCQKKQYAYFQNDTQSRYVNHEAKKSTTPVDVVENTTEEIILPTAPAETISANNAEAIITESGAVGIKKEEITNTATKTSTSVKKKMTFFQKVKVVNQLRKLSKDASKKTNSATVNPKGNPDTTALISLIAGIVGLVLLFTTGWLGLLLGLIALILGAVSLNRTNKRGMAIIGIILGALNILIFLIAIIFVAALIAAV